MITGTRWLDNLRIFGIAAATTRACAVVSDRC
jgi:hypothetical protein